jgi:Fe-S oxidoreductase
VNLFTQTPGLSALAKLGAGMPQARQIPAFAPLTFTNWFSKRPRRAPGHAAHRVMLWPDTFNNHFHPETAIAAVNVLERAGFEVAIPSEPVCCGRPLYDYGMLDMATRWLRSTLKTLAPEIAAGVPIVGLEPSCVAVFRDEMRELLPDREDAKRLASQVFLLSEFLNDRHVPYPQLHRKALVHAHCHHHSVMKFDAEEQALRSMGLTFEVLDSGCCGMAGSFGYEAEHHEMSLKIGELGVLPKMRAAAPDTLLAACGTSCRHQIADGAQREARHIVRLLDEASASG